MDFVDNQAVERKRPDTPSEAEYGADDDAEDPPKDDPTDAEGPLKENPTAKVGEQPDDDGTTKLGTETLKRARSDSADINPVDNSGVKLAMTEGQYVKVRKLVMNAAKQGLAFSPDTVCKFLDKKMVHKTAVADLVLTHPDGSMSDKIGCFGVWVSDAAKGTLLPYI